jgi:uncharacterized protein (DUF1499 family)
MYQATFQDYRPMRFILFLLVALIGLMGYIRRAPSRIDVCHSAPVTTGIGDKQWAAGFQAARKVNAPAEDVLRALEQRVRATPRTQLLAGDVDAHMITFVTRSAFWGFPDYTTVAVKNDLLVVTGRLRFGRSDMGVNKTRILAWLDQLAPLTEPL